MQRPWKRALAWLLFLAPFFFASYGFANWIASRRASVGAIVFGWEQQIPFVAWTIVPYWLIDLLYGLSLFLCATRHELDIHGKRLLCAQLISVSCFLLFPLRFSFERPQTEGLFGLMFDVLTGFDKPFNQAPSLHIALLTILWVLYAKYLTGAWRWLLHLGFTLIGVSVLTTYQHHFVDVPTGLWVGWLCVWLFPREGRSVLSRMQLTTESRRRSLALCYAVAAGLVAAAAFGLGGWGLWLLWVSGSLVIVAAIYAFLDEAAFQKRRDGSMSAATWWLLAPYLAGAWISSRWWTRSVSNADIVVPGLMIGRIPTRGERNALGLKALVDVTAELPYSAPDVHYVNVPQLDLAPPSVRQIDSAVRAIDDAFLRGPVLVCCALGFSRSAIAVAAWLFATGRAQNPSEAIQKVRQARPAVVFNSSHVEMLERFARRRAAAAM